MDSSYSGLLELNKRNGLIIVNHHPSDIALKTKKGDTFNDALLIAKASTGIQVREDNFYSQWCFIDRCACDSVQTWANNWHFKDLVISDELEYDYPFNNKPNKNGQFCHKDVIQMFRAGFNKRGEFELLKHEPVIGVSIGCLNVFVRGGVDKGSIIASEVGGVMSSRFFEQGVNFDTDSNNPYFFSSERLIEVVFGSADHPIESSNISDKAFRIGNIKLKEALCANWQIHCIGELNLELSESARKTLKLITYDRWI